MPNSTSEQPQFKTCSNPNCPCENPQLLDSFSKKKDGRDGLRAYCRVCHTGATRLWRNNNPELAKETARKVREANLNRERERSRQWRIDNPDRQKASIHRWMKANPDRMRANSHRRLARKRNLPDTFTAADWQHALDYFDGCCAACGRPAGLWHTIAADHWIALSDPACPGTVPTNIVPLCHPRKDGGSSCNVSKHNKNAEQWLAEKLGKRKAKQILARIQVYFDSLK